MFANFVVPRGLQSARDRLSRLFHQPLKSKKGTLIPFIAFG